MSGSEPRTPTEAVGGVQGGPGHGFVPPPPPPKFLLPPPPLGVPVSAFVPPQAQALPLVIKSEPVTEDDFLRSPRNLDSPPGQNRKRFGEESSHDEIIKSEFGGHGSGRAAIPSGRTILEFDGNDQVLCRVCGDKASGFHYGVHSCEGCKGFFRRSIQQKIQYRPCTKNQQCNILRINRNRCQYCRLKKCIAAGMSRDAVRFGRVPKREKAKILAAMQSSRMKTQESKVMGELSDDAKIIDCIVRAHYDTCDYTRKKMEPFLQSAKANPKYISCSGTTCPMKGRPEDSFLEQFSERFMDHVRQVCTFAKLIPGFKCLHHDDQVTLLKSCVFEVLLVRLAGLFDSQSLVCLNGDIIRKDTINAMVPGNAKFLMDSVFELAQRLNHFRLSDAEIGLFCAVVIITPDRPGLRNPELLMRMQNKLKMVLNSILMPQHPENESIFPELMTMVHDLRTLNTLHTEKFLQQCKIDNGPPASMASENNNSAYEAVSHQRWDSAHLDRESTGNGSPQSSSGGDTHSSTSLEDTSSRRSPMGSVSSTDSSTTSEVSKLLSTVQDLRMNGSSVLMTALTSQPSTGVTISRKTMSNGSLTTHCPMAAGTISTAVTMAVNANNIVNNLNIKYNHQMRKTDSPSTDSGVESGNAAVLHPTSSTNNSSVCSSPRSSSESETKGSSHRSTASASPPGNEERHPLLKRALQQPPQMFNNVNTFQDEVYKPHKKFRRHNNGFSKDECPSSSTQGRASSPEAAAAVVNQQPPPSVPSNNASVARSLLASQLAEPPQPYHPARSSSSSLASAASGTSSTTSTSTSSSLLASTLSQGIPLATEESKRNELLAQLILGDGRGGLPSVATTSAAASRFPGAGPQQRQPQGLLMCATGATPTWSSTSASVATPSYSQQPNRHIPVATLPTKPQGSSRMAASATVTSAEAASMQPLNLSKRIESKNNSSTAGTAAASSTSVTASQRANASSNGHDIPTEA